VTDLGWPELLIVCAIAMLLFGTKKMPEIARSVGRSMRIVKAELGGLRDDDTAQPVAAQPAAQPAAAQSAAAPAAAQPATAQPAAASAAAAPAPVIEPVTVQPIVVEPVAPAAPVHATGDTPTR
jgi:sec-independent protein translocase protein TatA